MRGRLEGLDWPLCGIRSRRGPPAANSDVIARLEGGRRRPPLKPSPAVPPFHVAPINEKAGGWPDTSRPPATRRRARQRPRHTGLGRKELSPDPRSPSSPRNVLGLDRLHLAGGRLLVETTCCAASTSRRTRWTARQANAVAVLASTAFQVLAHSGPRSRSSRPPREFQAYHRRGSRERRPPR